MDYRITRWKGGRHWSLTGPDGKLVCVCVYKKGAKEVKELLEGALGKEAADEVNSPRTYRQAS